jgi:hypothetical protein
MPKYKGYKIKKSGRKNKEYVAIKGDNKIHFADPTMDEAPGTKRGDNYCARSLGIAEQYNIKGDKSSPNYWSRQLWSCKGKKSKSSKRFFGKINL